jgi:UDP-N-acetylglucosamine transferase subunit ALG13
MRKSMPEPRIVVFHLGRGVSVLLDNEDRQLLFADSDGRYWKINDEREKRLFAESAVDLMTLVLSPTDADGPAPASA